MTLLVSFLEEDAALATTAVAAVTAAVVEKEAEEENALVRDFGEGKKTSEPSKM